MRAPESYIVFPLDVPSLDEAMGFVEPLKDQVGLFKVGLELFVAEGPSVIRAVHETAGRKVFLDLKLHDIPATVKRAFTAASRLGPRFITIHCDQGEGLLRDVAVNNPGDTQILAVTVLTSLHRDHLRRLGHKDAYADDISDLVLLKARIAMEAGCHGIVCSGHEVDRVRRELGDTLTVMTPGIRPAWSLVAGDDQKRIVTPEQAVRSGADYIVIGRPIRDAADPAAAAQKVADEIARAL